MGRELLVHERLVLRQRTFMRWRVGFGDGLGELCVGDHQVLDGGVLPN